MCDYNITLKRIDDIVKRGQNVILFKKLLKLVPINILIFFFFLNLGGPLSHNQYIDPSLNPFMRDIITQKAQTYYRHIQLLNKLTLRKVLEIVVDQ